MTFEIANFGNFNGYSQPEIVTSVAAYGQPDVTLLERVTIELELSASEVNVSIQWRTTDNQS